MLIALLVSLSSARSASATVLDMQNLVSLNSSLLNYYTFEGNTNTQRNQDKKGTLNLSPVTYGSATAGMIQYVTGFDATTTAVVTARPGGNNASDIGGLGGAGLSTTTGLVSFGTAPALTATVEMLVRPDMASLPGTNGIAVVAGVREQPSQKGYFLNQIPGSTPTNDDFVAFAGDAFIPASQQTILTNLQAAHWYYYATTFEVLDEGMGYSKTKITSYIADLTNGQTSLTSLGSFTTPDGNIFTNGVGNLSPLGVGILDNTGAGSSPSYGFAFPGGIDALALYTGQLNQSVLQSHLDAIWAQEAGPVPAPEPGSFALMLLGLTGLAVRRRKRRSE